MKKCGWLLGLFFLLCANAYSQEADSTKVKLTQKAFFSDDSPLTLTLTSDFSRLKRKRAKNAFQPAVAAFTFADGRTVTDTAAVSARGEFRRSLCSMPSLSVDFKSKKSNGLAGLKKLKMVCGCNVNAYFEDFVLKEYLAYKIYNLLTDMSFRVRLAKVTYTDAGNRGKAYTQYGFFVEDVDAMAKRNDCIEFEKPTVSALITDRTQLTTVTVFQFMIGNLDWSIPNRHNVRLIQSKRDSFSYPYPVPYDFDFCGLVNSPYTYPQEEFDVKSVTDRLYRGLPRSAEEIDTLLSRFREKRESIASLISGFEPLQKRQRDEMLHFLDGFYQTIENKRNVKAIFVEASRKNAP